ncbi:MAG TPA: universal stress protein [Albitalea sp.]|nr:universal stress protein [Albitalea sp.]
MVKILVAIDGSDASLRALRRAMGLAGEIHVVNVQLPPDAALLSRYMPAEDIDREQFENGICMLAPACKLLEDARATFRSHVLIGAPAFELAAFAQRENADEIVMGARGVGGLRSAVIGSTAKQVMQLAGVPVSVVE